MPGPPGEPVCEPTWAEELQAYERQKRYTVSEELCRGPPARIDTKDAHLRERKFDPLLQRLRGEEAEQKQLAFEQAERIKHLNRARDIHILREQPFCIVTHESKLEPIGGEPKLELTFADPNTTAIPTSTADYNIISTLPSDVHHWAPPHARPVPQQRSPRRRMEVPAFEVKDFNIITNKYLSHHPSKSMTESTLNALDATKKFRQRNRFDPVLQRFTDAQEEERGRVCDDARTVEATLRAEEHLPPAVRDRPTAFYCPVTHQVHDSEMLKCIDEAEKGRKVRYRTRAEHDKKCRLKDIEFEELAARQAPELVAHERFEETTRRGYDILTNREYGNGPDKQPYRKPFTTPRQTAWEKILADQDAERQIGAQAPLASARRSGRPPASTPRSQTLAGAGHGLTLKLPASSAPPAPSIPCSDTGSVYSRPKVPQSRDPSMSRS
mmetsp:Transcript_46882/g.101829  ORF Transcript_46882/g.101829 Transcript_46882/m.101829 type:complete len:440 (-) Transcript_46882:83-1402(-)